MNTFNLTFSGEILAGHNPARVKLRFGKMFAINDPERLERFFSGQTIILRRNLERKAAAQYYHELYLLGVVAALVKVTASATADTADTVVKAPPPAKTATENSATVTKSARIASKQAIAQSPSGAVDQTWAVSSRGAARNQPGKKARKDKALRPAAQAVDRAKSALAEQQRKIAEDNARKQEMAAASKRLADQERARQATEQARLKAEEAARLQAEREETQRREAEEAEQARLKAEEAVKRKAELEALERQKAEEAARLQAELDAIKRQEAEEAARIKAEAQRKQAEARRKSAERRRAAAEKVAIQRALRKEEKRKAAALQAEQKAQRAQQIEQKEEEAAQRRAEQEKKATQEQLEQTALSEALQEKAVQRAAAELAQQTTFKSAKARVKTRLEVPQRKTGQAVAAGAPAPRKRQAGEPNLYQLRPFRNTEEVRTRAAQAGQRIRQSYTLGALALAALLLVGGSFVQFTAAPLITGAEAVAIDPQSGPLLLAGNSLLFHDRAGIGTHAVPLSALGLDAMAAPLAFDSTGALLALGRLTGDSADPNGGNSSLLLRCKLALSTCQLFTPALKDSRIGAFVIHPLDGSLLLLDTAVGQLLKVNREGKIVARAAVPTPDHPVLRLHGGLLLMNSADGPGISIFRYDDSAFGQQLDEILLLPPAAQKADQSRVGDFVWSADSWWASLHNPLSGSIGLYRFDEEWNYLDEVALPGATYPLHLSPWGVKTLVSDPRHLPIQRLNAEGAIEAPFVSSQLADLIGERQHHARLTTAAWRGSLLLCALTAVLGFGFGYLQSLRRLVYNPRREHGAEPIDDYAAALHWIDPVVNRQNLLRRSGFNYGLLAIGILLLAIGLSVTTGQLAALLLLLSGPAIALLLLRRYPIGHIGILQGRLLLVDHNGTYHLAGGSSVQYRGPFLLIDDVVVFCGSRLLPAFSTLQIQKLVVPLALGGVKVDRNTVLVKLLECRHPLAQGSLAIIAAATAAFMLLCLHEIF